MIDGDILPLIRRRLTLALAPPAAPLLPLRVDAMVVGRLAPARAQRLLRSAGTFVATSDGVAFDPRLDTPSARTAAVDDVARALAAEGLLSGWRDEPYAVAPTRGAPPAFLLERAAARYFGIHTFAAHVNGLVEGAAAPLLWFARRARAKAIDPDRLDNLVGGGIAAGRSVAATVVKESWEEAGIPRELARAATPVGALHICREQPDGLQHETIFVHDLWLATEFVPDPQDGEAVLHRRVEFAEAARLIALAAGPDVVTAEASLVIVDCLLRHGALDPDAPDFLALAALRHGSMAACQALGSR